eukprot:53407_1
MISIWSAIIILLTITANAAVFPCDGVEYSYSGINVYLAAGVCQPDSDGTAARLECEDANTLNSVAYNSMDCTGSPIGTVSIVTGLQQQGVTQYTIRCCVGPCDYSLEIEYNTSSCTQSKTGIPFQSGAFTIGACQGIPGTAMYTVNSCTNGSPEMIYWMDATECAGQSIAFDGISDGFCDSESFNQYEVTCGTAVNTCPGMQTPQPTADTNAPTSDTGMPTITPSTDTYMPSVSPTINTQTPTIGTGNPTQTPTSDTGMPTTMSPTGDTTAPSKMPTSDGEEMPTYVGSGYGFNVLTSLWIVVTMVVFA